MAHPSQPYSVSRNVARILTAKSEFSVWALTFSKFSQVKNQVYQWIMQNSYWIKIEDYEGHDPKHTQYMRPLKRFLKTTTYSPTPSFRTKLVYAYSCLLTHWHTSSTVSKKCGVFGLPFKVDSNNIWHFLALLTSVSHWMVLLLIFSTIYSC